VTAANLNDREGLLGILAASQDLFPRLKKVWADSGYSGEDMERVIKTTTGIQLEITKRSDKEFKVLPRRWVVERSIAWINRYRRLSKDYEYRTITSEAMMYLAGIRLMLKRFDGYAAGRMTI
jgi:putative transposase